MPDAYNLEPKPEPAAPGAGDPSAKPTGKIDKPSVLEASDDEKCPRCGKPIGAAAVVCVNCGYDYRANMQRQVELAAKDTAREAEDDDRPEFVTVGVGSAPVIAAIGAATLVAAAATAGYFASAGGTKVVAATVALLLFQALIHVPSGLLALMSVAWLRGERFGRVDLAAARVLLALALFLLVRSFHIPVPSIGVGIQWALGMLAYWTATMLLFRKSPEVAGQIGAFHLAIFVAIHLLMWLEVLLSAAAVVPPRA